MSFKANSLALTDGYKPGHKFMLAKNTTKLYGTWIPRSLKHAPKGVDKIVSIGQQYVWRWLKDHFDENFFFTEETREHRKNNNVIGLSFYKEKAMSFVKDLFLYTGQDLDFSHFGDLFDLGFLPLEVKALPEGTLTEPNIPHMTFANTVDGFGWLPLYLETPISYLAWRMSTSASIARVYRQNAVEWVTKTDKDALVGVDYMCHDFSSRGLDYSATIESGIGHASSFKGSDTLIVIPAARYFYDEPLDEVCIGSVIASEHSVSTTKIFTVGESNMIKDWLTDFPNGIFSLVSDTFDLWRLINEYLVENKDLIMGRDGKLTIRPDSGDPVDIICGEDTNTEWKDISEYFPKGDIDPQYFWDYLEEDSQKDVPHGYLGPTMFTQKYKVRGEYYIATVHNLEYNRFDKQYYYLDMYSTPRITFEKLEKTPEMKGVVELLWGIFGGTVNDQGYKVLDPHVGVIYGDSITLERQVAIYKRLEAKGFAASNVVLGIGSFTYQYVTRDTLGFAAKGAWFEVINEDGIREGYNIFKDPITDDGTKKSLKGLQQVYLEDGQIKVKGECTPEEEKEGLLQTIFKDGEMYNQTTLTEIRKKLMH